MIMKRIHLLLIALMLSMAGMAQTRLTSPQTGSISIQNPGESVIATYPVDKTYFSLAPNNVRIYILGTGPSPSSPFIIANNNANQYLLNGAAATDTASVKAYLMALGVGKASSGGGGGGGGGDASAANQIAGNNILTQIRNNQVAGAKTGATSQSVVPATDATFPISAASLPLPTGASTSANQTSEITQLTNINNKIPTVGQKTGANSQPVVIASDQTTVPVSVQSMVRPLNAKVPSAVTVGTTSTQLLAADAAGYRTIISVPSTATASVWITFGATAVTAPPSLELTPGSSYQTTDGFPDTQQITAISTVSVSITVIKY